MNKSIFAALLLFVVMICTAVEVSRTVPGDTQPGVNSAAMAGTQVLSQSYKGSILESTYPKANTYGSGSGLEDNPFIIAFGLTLILTCAFGFWKYHQIHQERQETADAAQAAERKSRKSARFKFGGGKGGNV